jgi:serine/threonine protein kinase
VVGELDGSEEDKARLGLIHSLAKDVAAWRPLFGDAGLDRTSFHTKFDVPRDVLLRCLASSYRQFDTKDPDGVDYLGLFLLTVLLLEESERTWSSRSTVARQEQLPPEDRGRLRDELIRDPAVRSALKELYRPEHGTPAATTWEDIDFGSLSFHRLGTTSFILEGREEREDEGTRKRLALKCVLYPYTKLTPIAEATSAYAARFSVQDAKYLISVWASTDKWIVMDFVEGDTLAEFVDRKHEERPGDLHLRLDLLDQLGLPLFRALEELQRQLGEKPYGDVAHQDLSPTNVIVEGRDPDDPNRYQLKLIDLGRNYLYTRAIGALEGPAAVYVAPEVKDETPGTHSRADLYSLGQVLITIGSVGRNADGTVPDGFYERTPPLLARFIEDLIDQDPNRRLLLFLASKDDHATGTDDWTFTELGQIYEQELDAVREADAPMGAPTDEHWLGGAAELLPLSSHSPTRLLRLRQQRKKQERERQHTQQPKERRLREDRERSVFSRWLLAWSWVCATSWYLVATVLLFLIARDVGFDLTPVLGQAVDAALGLFAGEQAPTLEDLVRSSQGPPDFLEHLPERAVGVSFALIGTKYYQNLYAGLTPLMGHRRAPLPDRVRSYTTESLMRLQTFWWVFLIFGGNLVEAGWWPICTAIGMTGVFFMNWACSAFSNRAIGRARQPATRLSTVPDEHHRMTGLEMFNDWTPSMLFYTLFVWPTALLISLDVLKDELVYAAGVVTVNLGLFYYVKCSKNAAAVRSGLARAFLAAERLRYLVQR